MRYQGPVVCGLLLGGFVSTCASGVVIPFTETFSGPPANWSSAAAFAALNYVPAGGPDGSGYGSGSFGFANNGIGSTPILFRAQTEFGSSAGALFGDWLGAGVPAFSFSVRHNAPSPVQFFARFVGGTSPTGVIALQPTFLPGGEWGTYTVTMAPSSFIAEGSPALFGSTFSNVTKVQIGLMMDSALALQPGPFTFDVDNFTIIPAPGAGATLIGAMGLGAARRRRR